MKRKNTIKRSILAKTPEYLPPCKRGKDPATRRRVTLVKDGTVLQRAMKAVDEAEVKANE